MKLRGCRNGITSDVTAPLRPAFSLQSVLCIFTVTCRCVYLCIRVGLHLSLTSLLHKGSSFSKCQGPFHAPGGEGNQKRSKRGTERAVTLGKRERDRRRMTRCFLIFLSALCLIMSLLMLILPSDALHFIKGLTFVCDSQAVQFPTRDTSKRRRRAACEWLILSLHKAGGHVTMECSDNPFRCQLHMIQNIGREEIHPSQRQCTQAAAQTDLCALLKTIWEFPV